MILKYRNSFLREIRKIYIQLSGSTLQIHKLTISLQRIIKVQKLFLHFRFHEQQTQLP